MSVTISLDLERDSPPTTAQIHGGVRIEIDGNVVTRFTDVEGTEIEYTGTWIVIDVGELVGTMIELKNGEHALYDRIVVDVGGTIAHYVIEPLSEHELRFAIQVASHGPIPLEDRPASEDALGYIVDVDEFGCEVVRAGRELVAFAEERDLELARLADRVDELESLLNEFDGIRFERGKDGQ